MTAMTMDESVLKQYYADSPPTVVKLAIEPHFSVLSEQQKLYAHHISRASHLGTRIILRSVSPESEAIYDLILSLHKAFSGNWAEVQAKSGISDEDLQYFLEYAAQFLGNCGNYKGFGDSKFIPRLPPTKFEKLVAIDPVAEQLFKSISHGDGGIYANTKNPGLMHLGWPDRHLSNYYPNSPSITEEEISLVGDFLAGKKLLPENTRIRKLANNDFEVLIASAIERPPADSIDTGTTTSWRLSGKLDGRTVSLVFGDHREEMAKIALEIKRASLCAADEIQKKMMEEYAASFGTGSMQSFLESQKLWVRNISPSVESNIGFIESYRDPAGVRAEWEGFVAMVNQERTRAFTKLVEAAPRMIPKLPWSKEFEKDKFVAPDFTSLEVLSFASSGIPAGINIPNFEDIRQEIGFKNVSLGNVLSAKAPNEVIPFIHNDDLDLYRKHRDKAFEVQVGIHELLGHGSGKVLQQISKTEWNFDAQNRPKNPLTGQPVARWYTPGQTYSSVFGALSSTYEECRAETVAMFLCCDFEILDIFGFSSSSASNPMQSAAGDVLHVSYLSMARAGIASLEFWDPKSRKWGQAHMQARFAILQVFLEAGNNFVTISPNLEFAEDLSDLVVRVDRDKILSDGRPAVGRFLQKLHIYKMSANIDAARAMYDKYTEVSEKWAEKVRPVVMSKKLPRKIFVQGNTLEKDGKVELKEYDPTLEGIIQSFAEREI